MKLSSDRFSELSLRHLKFCMKHIYVCISVSIYITLPLLCYLAWLENVSFRQQMKGYI